ncbi:GyrI-like small molecule binding domain-containing protein [Neorhodopirellula lusitana]|uniref:GyrI-like small molecule binding domain-containing protein n=1 Tax=Neorhodopirellula lusitana TaxID=445327 RepID=A0ABY1QB46_9BACT|nr:SRPBCC family protein [Neorhodopirellula lusitana]SMP65272.1 GyrI-like small molecule binding domain-containing protein [Neorhodopirellula lusitana]
MPSLYVNESILIHAPIQQVFDTVANFGTWSEWSPWLVADPDCEIKIDGEASQAGGCYQWNGDVCGQGSMTHMKVEAPHRLVEQLTFIKPFRSQAEVLFEFESVGDQTRVNWIMNGTWPWLLFWMKKQMAIFISMDYHRGLKRLKTLIETGSIPAQTTISPGLVTPQKFTFLGQRGQCEWADIATEIGKSLESTQSKLAAAAVTQAEQVVTVYEKVDLKKQRFEFLTGYVTAEQTPCPAGLIKHQVGGEQSVHIQHVGCYGFLDDSWSAIYQIARARQNKPSSTPSYELNRNLPDKTPKSELISELYLPVKR